MNLLTVWTHLKNAEAAAKPVVAAIEAAHEGVTTPTMEQAALVGNHQCVLSALRTGLLYAERVLGPAAVSEAKAAFNQENEAKASEAAAAAKLAS